MVGRFANFVSLFVRINIVKLKRKYIDIIKNLFVRIVGSETCSR